MRGLHYLENEPISNHSPYRVGGTCAQWAVVHHRDKLIPLIGDWSEKRMRFSVMGTGTKILFRDGGVEHAVLRLGYEFQQCSLEGDVWTLGAGLPLILARHRMALAGVLLFPELSLDSGTLGGLLASATTAQWTAMKQSISSLEVATGSAYRWRDIQSMKSCPKVVTAIRLKSNEHLSEAPNKAVLPRYESPWFDGPGDLKQKRSMLRRCSMSGARLHGILMPAEMPDQMVNIGQSSANDFWELHRSALDRIRRFHGVTWSCGLKWQGRK